MKRAGEVWLIHHQRKGDFTIRLLTDVSENQEWFDAELVDGKPQYASIAYNLDGARTPGQVISIRQSLMDWMVQK